MKFLIDAQLPSKISNLFRQKGFDSIHTKDLPNGNLTTDKEIIEISKIEKRIVVTKDSDFYNTYLGKSEPFKVIYMTVGNISNEELTSLLNNNFDKIIQEIELNQVVELTKNSIITII